jgi:hypothetical protein
MQAYAISLKCYLHQRFSKQRLTDLKIDIKIVLAKVSTKLSLSDTKYTQSKQKTKQPKTTINLLINATENDKYSEIKEKAQANRGTYLNQLAATKTANKNQVTPKPLPASIRRL